MGRILLRHLTTKIKVQDRGPGIGLVLRRGHCLTYVSRKRGMAMSIKTLKFIMITAGLSVALAGCETLQTYNPFTQEPETSNAAKGAAIGAAAGAVVGLASGDDAVERRQHALIGAGVGALAGGAIGYYMDQQEAKLRAELQGTGVSVTRIGDNITLNMAGNITFATNSSDLSPAFLTEFDKTVVEVAGHTDGSGSNSYNQSLSEKRAGSVAQYLQSQGIINERLLTIGLGETMPVADNNTAKGKQENRRVESTMVPVTTQTARL
jgi:outer membrane protein OmpA-like peptidoglycan-associated protein